jgi:hypothetical protein
VKQYYPHDPDPNPANCLVAQFHAPQTMKWRKRF